MERVKIRMEVRNIKKNEDSIKTIMNVKNRFSKYKTEQTNF